MEEKQKDKTSKFLLLLLLLLSLTTTTTSTRPQLVKSDVWVSENRIVSTDFQTISGNLEFDQPLYLAESILCPRAEEGCEPLDCVPCDWSGENPTGCDDLNCCGPAEYPEFVGSRNDWCEPSSEYEHTTIELGTPSSKILLKAGETKFFRFFLGEETTCFPVAVKARFEYGTANMYISRVDPFPVSDDNAQFIRETSDFSIGQVDWILCPNLHEDFGPGTWSVGITAVMDSSFYMDVFLGPDRHPISSSPQAIPCSEVPEGEKLHSPGDVSLCLEEGETQAVLFTTDFETNFAQILLPIPEGCHTVNVAVAPPKPSGSSQYDLADADLYCHPTDSTTPVTSRNALIGLWQIGDDRLSFTGCFEETTYVHCAAQLWVVGEAQFLFSLESGPHRFPILDTLPGSLTMDQGLGAVTASINGWLHPPCADFYSGCFEWTSYPSSDPLTFWPPHGAVETIDTFFSPVPSTEYFEKDLAKPLENTISFSIGLLLGSERVYTVEELLANGTLTLPFLTNEAGEPVQLPKPGKMQADSFGSFLPNTAFSELNLQTDVSSRCTYNSYSVLSDLVDDQVTELLNENSLTDVTSRQYQMDVYNAGLVRLSCLQAGEQVLEKHSEIITKARQTSCDYAFDTVGWNEDPCCNANLKPIACCIPSDRNVEENLFTEADTKLTQTCGSPQCAETFFDDLAGTLNTFKDPVLGCNSGIKNFKVDLDFQVESAFNNVLRACREEVGLGEGFVGMTCDSDEDCTNWLGTCGSTGYCDLPTLSVVEDQYLTCYINRMSSVTEDYLRREVLGRELENAPKSSPEFYDAVRLAASEGACISPSSPLDVSQRTRREWVSELGPTCKAEILGLTTPNEDKIHRDCPTLNCLGTSSCWGNLADLCYANCETGWIDYFGVEEGECGEEVCNVDLEDCEGEDVCVYCPMDGSLPCQTVEGITSQEECESLVACQLPNGDMVLGITEDECNTQQGVCTVDCLGDSCQSLKTTKGGCFVSSIVDSDSCDEYATNNDASTQWVSTDVDSVCAVAAIDENECAEYPSTSWNTCSEIALDNCDGTTAIQVYLQCYHSPWQSCSNQNDCEEAGHCSDREAITTLRNEDPVQVDLGSCFSSGFSLFSIDHVLPFFCHASMEEPIIGCKEVEVPNEASCLPFEILNLQWYWRRWMTPAMSEEECVSKEFGRYGCLFPGEYPHLSWHNDTYCECMGGFPTFAWEWETGKWLGGQARPLSWVSVGSSSKYEYKENALSFYLLESWLEEAIEEYFLYDLKSQVLCENNVITVPLRTVVCDCLAEDSPKDPSCYTFSTGHRATPVGLSAACSGEASLIKGPSAFANFDVDSVNNRCTEIDLLVIEETWFSEPPSSGQVSFQFERNEPRKGFVKNDNGVTVGQLAGDGCELRFSHADRVDTFNLCLLISSDEEDTDKEYPVRDFGYSDSSESEVIIPLGIESDIIERRVSDFSVFWCANLTLKKIPTTEDEGVYQLFPIVEMEDYNKQEEDYTDETTKVLCYVLGSFYLVDFFLLVLFFIILVKDIQRTDSSIPLVSWLGVIFMVLCIFRVVFLFSYPNAVFEDEELAEFVVFEIPTFLLFTAVFFCIFLWRNLAQKKNFFGFARGSRSNQLLIGSCLISVWMLFMVVTIVYSEVILEEGEQESECPGRVAATSSIEEDSRVLSIVYQSIIITVTFLLAVVFFQSSYVLFRQSSKGVSDAKYFIFRIGAIIVSSFFLRCIFFIILLAAEFTSSIYMFIVLMITEVFMIFLIHLQFNEKYYKSFFNGTSNILPSGMLGSRTTATTAKSGTDMDD